jgi:hypothetical protein
VKPPVEWRHASANDLADVRAVYLAESLERGNSQALRDYCAAVARMARREHLRRVYPTHELRRRGYTCQRELAAECYPESHHPCVRIRLETPPGDAWGELITDPTARYQRPIDAWDEAREVIARKDGLQ